MLCVCEPGCHRGSLTAETKGRWVLGERGVTPASSSSCPALCPDIIHKFIRDKYSKRFPEAGVPGPQRPGLHPLPSR